MPFKIIQLLAYKCPNCLKSKAFKEQKGLSRILIPKMKNCCSNCNFSFNKEPGFYYGAMYISYGLTIIESITVFIVAQQLFEVQSNAKIIGIIAVTMMFLMRFNYKLSRILWLNIFKNYQN